VILQNKPNFPKTKMHINLYQETAYENIAPSNNPKNKPNQTQFSRFFIRKTLDNQIELG